MLAPERGALARPLFEDSQLRRRDAGTADAARHLHVVDLHAVDTPRFPVPDAIRAISDKIADYLETTPLDRPRLVLDLDIVERNYRALEDAFGGSRVHYAVKANPAPEVISRLVALGSAFDCASWPEIALCLEHGAEPTDICFGNTIKREREIAEARAHGISLFAVDSAAEVEKVARAAPGASVYCRILTTGDGADWPLSRKFGCDPAMAADLMVLAADLGLDPVGVSFHVGSQQTNPENWRSALTDARRVFDAAEAHGLTLRMVDLGGGMPARYRTPLMATEAYGATVVRLVREIFGPRALDLMIEPGRGMVGDAAVIQAEVLLVSKKAEDDEKRWVFLDIGKFSGLAETMEEAIKYRFFTAKDGEETGPVVIAGPTCDSADVLYEKTDYRMPMSLRDGDRIWIPGTGAYTTTYSSIAFNGFPPLDAVCL